MVTVSGSGKWLFLAGVGAEAEKDGSILFIDDFAGQCRFAYQKIAKLLDLNDLHTPVLMVFGST